MGKEIHKTRPAIIISGTVFNQRQRLVKRLGMINGEQIEQVQLILRSYLELDLVVDD